MTTSPTSTRRPRVRPFNTLFGLFFLAAAGLWAARGQDVLDGDQIGRAVAVGLIVLGVLGLAATLVVSRRGRAPRAAAPVAPDYDETDDIDPDRRD
ncbi:hypothetical protein [Aeromicrobium sp. Leaf272]|uniref:hypothetical protein n=1 Tax=Aeromicrobium sp. Leaf272 TaxID=1736317 RepID=UPI0006FE5BDC|nr:hypothetical protein [Aeromicrobium sp. Leaf272]KQP27385.1 hypothetical protein ASF38_06495 [Aeromicrobium sp. Leaf272]